MPYDKVVRAVYNYEASAPDELSFDEDDLIFITDRRGGDTEPDDSWLSGRTIAGDKTGLVPANYIEPIEEVGKVKALYEYAAQEENELSFVEDEVLCLFSKLDSDWWLVRGAQGAFGLIPSNYVEELGNQDSLSATGNIFNSKTSVSPLPMDLTLDGMFPSGVGSKKKWSADLMLDGTKYKGKLLWLLDVGQMVFIHGKDKKVAFNQNLSSIKSFDRKSGDLFCESFEAAGRSVQLILGKSDGKELECIIEQNTPILPGPINIIKEDCAPNMNDINEDAEVKDIEVDGTEVNDAEVDDAEVDDAEVDGAKVDAAEVDGAKVDDAKVDDAEVDDSETIIVPHHRDDDNEAQFCHQESKDYRISTTGKDDTLPGQEKSELFAQYDYEAQDEDEINLTTGERVFIVEGSESDDWWLVRCEEGDHHRQGLVPKNYLSNEPAAGEDEYVIQGETDCENAEEATLRETGDYRANDEEPKKDQQQENHDNDGDQQQSIEQAKDIEIEEDSLKSTRTPPAAPFLSELLTKSQRSLEIVKQIDTQRKQSPPAVSYAENTSTTEVARGELRIPPPPPLPGRLTAESTSSILPLPDKIAHTSSIIPPAPKLPDRSTLPKQSLEREPTKPKDTKQSQPPPRQPHPSQPVLDLSKVNLKPIPKTGKSASSIVAPVKDTTTAQPAVKSTTKPVNPWANVTLKRSDSTSKKKSSTSAMDMSSLGKSLPSRPAKVESSSNKPNPSDTRLWKDKTGQFQTEAAFISYDQGALLLHKLNGGKVKVPIDLLSERDVEYVCRRCGLNASTILAVQGKSVDTITSTTKEVSYKVKGFDWPQFLIESGVDRTAAPHIANQLVETGCDELWLDGLSRDKLKAKLPSLSDADALLVMQGVTKRRLQKLEKLGQDKILQSISQSTAAASLQPTPALSAQKHFSSTLQTPLQPIRTSPSSQSTLSAAAPPPAPKRSIKDVPSLQPASNSFSSVKITQQPLYKEYTSSTLLPLPNGQMAQQQTTTQYMFQAGARTMNGSINGQQQPHTNGRQPYMSGQQQPHTSGQPPYMSGQQQPYMTGQQQPHTSGQQQPYMSGQQQSYLSSQSLQQNAILQSTPMQMQSRPQQHQMPIYQMPLQQYHQQTASAQHPPQWNNPSVMQPSGTCMNPTGNGSVGNVQSQAFVGSIHFDQLPNQLLNPPNGTHFTANNYIPPDGDKYSIFRAVDPKSPSLLTGKSSQQQPTAQPLTYPPFSNDNNNHGGK